MQAVTLAHLGDTPMHAEIANCPHPGSSLNPCRFCTLQAMSKLDRATSPYVKDFIGVDKWGNRVSDLGDHAMLRVDHLISECLDQEFFEELGPD